MNVTQKLGEIEANIIKQADAIVQAKIHAQMCSLVAIIEESGGLADLKVKIDDYETDGWTVLESLKRELFARLAPRERNRQLQNFCAKVGHLETSFNTSQRTQWRTCIFNIMQSGFRVRVIRSTHVGRNVQRDC